MDKDQGLETGASSSRVYAQGYTTTGTVATRSTQSFYKTKSKQSKVTCQESQSTSHTQFYKKNKGDEFQRITREEYLGKSESLSTSESYHCIHGPEGKQYTKAGLLKRNLIKNLDPIPSPDLTEKKCPPGGWDVAKKLDFMITDAMVGEQTDRIIKDIKDFAEVSADGFKMSTLMSVTVIVDYLVEMQHKSPELRECLMLMLQNVNKPIQMDSMKDIVTLMDDLREYLGFLGYLLVRLEEDSQFDLVAQALIWHLSCQDKNRSTFRPSFALAVAAPGIFHTVIRMLAVVPEQRFSKFAEMALILALDTTENCLGMLMENIIEIIFYRFNPYFPDKTLPVYETNPEDTNDIYNKLGASYVNMTTVLSLLLVLLKTTIQCLEENKIRREDLPSVDDYAQRCFIWAYRFTCRAREHKQARITLTVIVQCMLHVFGNRLATFGCILMADVMSLSVLTELPPRLDWTNKINFNNDQSAVYFKRMLIYLSVAFLQIFPYNRFMVESRNWLVGLMYLLDPGLSSVRAHWSPALFAEVRKTSIQALIITAPLIPAELIVKCNLIRRIMWYIEWYCECPYEVALLYFCVRLLQTCLFSRQNQYRSVAMQQMFDTHGIIIIMKLCDTLMNQKLPPVEKSQIIISLSLNILTSAAEHPLKVNCCVYPGLKWPGSIMGFTKNMMNVILYTLDKNSIIHSRWLLSFLNFVWENVIWKPERRKVFVADDGIYKLLDIMCVSRYPVQCMIMAMILDIALSGEGVVQLVTWRANLHAQIAHARLVKQGDTIVTLLTSLYRNDCLAMGFQLDENGIIEDTDSPLQSAVMKANLKDFIDEGQNNRTPYCSAAANMCGSRRAKTFALLQLLSDDLKAKVAIADEAYKLFKNIKLSLLEENLLVLMSHYLTIKQQEVWVEIEMEAKNILPDDQIILEEFMNINKGWMKDIRNQQLEVVRRRNEMDRNEEKDLYSFLARVRLNVALDALREVRCVARSSDRAHMSYALLHDAVNAYHRRSTMVERLQAPVIRTFGPTLDDQNITAKKVKVFSIMPRYRSNRASMVHNHSQSSDPPSVMEAYNIHYMSL